MGLIKFHSLLLALFGAGCAYGQVIPSTTKFKLMVSPQSSLPRLVELAEAQSPLVQKAKNNLETARLEARNAQSEWLPKVDLDAVQGYSGADPRSTGARPLQSSLNVVASENLYDNGASIKRYQIAKRKLERAQLEYEQARDQQLLAVANSYYDWSQAIQQREILENKRDLLRRQFRVMESQYKQGLKTKRDVLRIDTELRKLELSALNSDNEIDLGLQKLSAFVGVSRENIEQEKILGEETKPIPSTVETPRDLKAENHRQAKIIALSEREADLQTSLIHRDYWPQFLLAGSFGFHNHDYIDTGPNTWEANHSFDWSALLTIKYNIWDFGIRRRRVEIARINERNVVAQGRQTLLDLSNDLREVTLRLRSIRENVRLTRELLVLEQQSYGMLETDFRNGRASYLDLITNLNSLIDARAKFMDSYFGLKKQQALYFFHQGVLYENLKQK